MTTQEILQAAQTARLPLAMADTHTKNETLEAMAVALIAAQEFFERIRMDKTVSVPHLDFVGGNAVDHAVLL